MFRAPREKAPIGEYYAILGPGIGGTGVVTINALLATAAWIDGLSASHARPDRHRAKGRRGRFEHHSERAPDRNRVEDQLRQCRPAAGLRSAGRGQRREPQARASVRVPSPWSTQPKFPPETPSAARRRSPDPAAPSTSSTATRTARVTSSSMHRASPRAVRQPPRRERVPAGRRLSGRPHPAFRCGDRGGDPSERRGSGPQYRGVSLGPQIFSRRPLGRGVSRSAQAEAARPCPRPSIARASCASIRTPPTPSSIRNSCGKSRRASPRSKSRWRDICTS